MTKRIRNTGPTEKRIRNTGPTERRIEPDEVAAALGAERMGERFKDALSPLTLLMVRQELFRRLQSSGGRPALSGTTRRAKIPVSDAEWSELEELAAAVSSPGFAPTAGQVASVLLRLSLQTVAPQVEKPASRSRAKSGRRE